MKTTFTSVLNVFNSEINSHLSDFFSTVFKGYKYNDNYLGGSTVILFLTIVITAVIKMISSFKKEYSEEELVRIRIIIFFLYILCFSAIHDFTNKTLNIFKNKFNDYDSAYFVKFLIAFLITFILNEFFAKSERYFIIPLKKIIILRFLVIYALIMFIYLYIGLINKKIDKFHEFLIPSIIVMIILTNKGQFTNFVKKTYYLFFFTLFSFLILYFINNGK